MQTTSKLKTAAGGHTQTDLLFGEFLVAAGLLTGEQLDRILAAQQTESGRVGEVAVRLQMLSERQVTEALAGYLGIEFHPLDDLSGVDLELARSLPESLAKRFDLIVIGEHDRHIVVAMGDPLNVVAIDTITLKMRNQVHVVIACPSQVAAAIDTIYHGSDAEEQKLRDLVEVEDGAEHDEEIAILEDEDDSTASNAADADKAPVIRFVDLLLRQAIKSRASDIHIEPQEKSMVIRMRVDGALREMVPPARKMQAAVLARIKILSNMDIAERRLPQDGRFKVRTFGRDIDVRVSILPTIYGEKVVMRILDKAAVKHSLDELGFDAERLAEFRNILSMPHGIILVTGPTGSGKSTTLYSALNYLKDPTKNITTVEDPVEYRLAGINQIQVKPEIKLDFARCLRSILRQDPDIILIGEMRDAETVSIAIKAALTGHLVLSTFHTNDAPSTISRFLDMDVEPFLLASTIRLILAQRLVRKICDKCKEPAELEPALLKRLNVPSGGAFYQGAGCTACGGTGYRGRLPVFEFLPIDHELAQMIVEGRSEADIRDAARKKGYGGLLDSGIRKMTEGLTTADEVLRVAAE